MENTTKIYRFHQYGSPEVLQLDAVPSSQEQVKFRARTDDGLNRDLLWLANTYGERSLPHHFIYLGGYPNTVRQERRFQWNCMSLLSVLFRQRLTKLALVSRNARLYYELPDALSRVSV